MAALLKTNGQNRNHLDNNSRCSLNARIRSRRSRHVLIVGGWLSGRYTPLHVYGPSGATPELGIKAAMDGVWDGFTPPPLPEE